MLEVISSNPEGVPFKRLRLSRRTDEPQNGETLKEIEMTAKGKPWRPPLLPPELRIETEQLRERGQTMLGAALEIYEAGLKAIRKKRGKS